MFNLGTIGAAVTLNTSAYMNALNALGAQTKAILGKAAGIALAYMGFQTLKGSVEGCVNAFMVQENAVNGLNRALANKGAVAYSEQLQKLASDLQLVTTNGDEATMATMALGINMGIPAAQMEDATKAAMGLAAAYNIDLNTAMQLIAKAYNGQTGTLSRYGIILDQSKSKQEQFNELLRKGKDAFPLAEAQTTGQKLQQLKNVWGDLTEAVGEFIVKLFGIGEKTDGVTKKIQDLTATIYKNMDEWVFNIKMVYTYIEEYTKMAWAVVEPAITYLVECFIAGCKNIYNIAVWLGDTTCKIWNNIGLVASAVWEDIKLTTDNIVEAIRQNFISQFTFLVEVLESFGRNWYSIFTDLWEICKRTMATIGVYFTSSIENIANMAASLGRNFWDLVTGKKKFSEAFGNVVNDYMAAVENTARQVQEQWEGFELGEGTKQFGRDVADAAGRHVDRMLAQADKIASDLGKNTREAMDKIGVEAFPEMQSGDFNGMIGKYSQLQNTLGDIAEVGAAKRAKLEEEYARRGNKKELKNTGNAAGGPEAVAGKTDVAGSFSAAVLDAMLGSGTPEKETAKNTKEMVRLQRQQLAKTSSTTLTYA